MTLTSNDHAFAIWCDGEGVGLKEFHFGSSSVCATGIVGVSRPGQCRRLKSLEIQLANYIIICAAKGKYAERGRSQNFFRHEINSMTRNRMCRSHGEINLRMANSLIQIVSKSERMTKQRAGKGEEERRVLMVNFWFFLANDLGGLLCN
jgi:hypothetical protein